MRLGNKVAIVTGAGSGIGRASALLFAREGAKVVVADINEQDGRETVESIKKNGGEGIFVRTDISKAADAENMVKETVSKFGRLDILFNNAGINPLGTVVDTPEAVWDTVIDVNLKGVFLCSKYAVPEMIRCGGGAIVNTASINAVAALPNEVAYHASKGGVAALTRAMAMDHIAQSIRVNCICPGVTATPILTKYVRESKNPQETEKLLLREQPINRFAKPEEIAQAALFLASDEASFVTGTTLFVDGGYTAH
ncbi:MAG TPA: SDR family oxidoreductase [Candidatus Acidoferrum sp.]|nr:SDR family oxidoreductase [Candidatus Acidoferrum sp.]